MAIIELAHTAVEIDSNLVKADSASQPGHQHPKSEISDLGNVVTTGITLGTINGTPVTGLLNCTEAQFNAGTPLVGGIYFLPAPVV